MINKSPWWQKAVIYQIYPKSFQDTNNDGKGDLLGIIKRLDYLKLLGVDAIWLTPFYPSPQIDNGYDVSDYTNVDKIYGNINDFDNLIKSSHDLGIKIIIDMVFNHSSTKHKWFIKSLDPKSNYSSYYIWKNASKNGGVPNNWQSKFGGQAWSWHKKRKQYYLHLWTPEQADFNWENHELRSELKKIIYFWANRGIDGLRLDVINLISKPKNFPNDKFGDGSSLYTDGPNIHKYIKDMNCNVFKPLKLMTVGEMASTNVEHCLKYSSLNGKELSMIFNFDHVEVDFFEGNKWNVNPLNLIKLKSIFNHWQTKMHNKAWNALFWCNHDQPRIVSRWGNEKEYRTESSKLFAIILHGMQGTPYIYQGEEIGMINPKFCCISDYKDIESHNIYKYLLKNGIKSDNILKILSVKSRDNSRTPMQWDNTINGGFTKVKPWIKMSNSFNEINVKNALNNKNSVFYTYKKLINLRKKYDVITFGDYLDLQPDNKYLWCYKRQFKKEKLLVLANISSKTIIYDIKDLKNWKILISNYLDVKNNFFKNMQLRPYEGIWLYNNL